MHAQVPETRAEDGEENRLVQIVPEVFKKLGVEIDEKESDAEAFGGVVVVADAVGDGG